MTKKQFKKQRAELSRLVFIQIQIERAQGRKTEPKECLKIVLEGLKSHNEKKAA